MSQEEARGAALLVNPIGLHARPSVKFTQLAKTFAAQVEFALAGDGPWIDAKSPVKVMRAKAPRGTTLHFRASGPDAQAAVAAMVALIERRFDEAEPPAGSSAEAGA
ncbi:MAG TPA: HPr family phosphocarrier protein [Burkholderiaceae bacterium]|nr:HPr family phosphocarrier protein [Burkholderiaceae bacterium]